MIFEQVGKRMLRFFAIILVICVLVPAEGLAQRRKTSQRKAPAIQTREAEQDLKVLYTAASQSRARLLEASETYRESLVKLLALQKQDAQRIETTVEKNRKLLDMGLIARRQLEESELEFTTVREKVNDVEKQLQSLENLVAEVHLAEELAKAPVSSQFAVQSAGRVVRYVGASRWAMNDFTKVDAFFRLRFSKPLPISAYGQTETHNRMGFDHRVAIDVAIHPDSLEGRELMNYLAAEGISFIAIRGAISGSATGAHIHIGPSSKRIN